jgi:hypothetical protein
MRGGALKDMDRVVGRRCGAQDRFQHSFAAAQSVALGQPPHAEEGSDLESHCVKPWKEKYINFPEEKSPCYQRPGGKAQCVQITVIA